MEQSKEESEEESEVESKNKIESTFSLRNLLQEKKKNLYLLQLVFSLALLFMGFYLIIIDSADKEYWYVVISSLIGYWLPNPRR